MRASLGSPPSMLTLPNILTLSRILTVPVLVACLWWPHWPAGYAFAFGLYCLMGVTDYFDGYLARAQGTVSKLGIFLDPIADKIMVAAVILMLVGTGDLRAASQSINAATSCTAAGGVTSSSAMPVRSRTHAK